MKIMDAVSQAEKCKYGAPTEMFLDVFDKPSRLLEKQLKEFREHIKAHQQHYPLNKYEKM